MIDINQIFGDKTIDITYENTVKRKYSEYINNSDLPSAYIQNNIDVSRLPNRIKILKENITNIVDNRYSYIFNVKDYCDVGYLSSLLIDSYFIDCMKNDKYIENVIYVDTNLLLEDYKKLMDFHNEDLQMSLAHNITTLTRFVDTAPCVIWDRFSFVNSNYDKQKLYNLILIRSRRGLGNLFFIEDYSSVMANVFNEEMYSVMKPIQIIDFTHQQLKYIEEGVEKDKGGKLW